MEHLPEETVVSKEVPQYAPKKTKSLLGYGLACLFATATFFSGIQVGAMTGDSKMSISSIFDDSYAAQEDVDLSLFWKVWGLLDQRFVISTTTDPLSDEERMWGAVEGLVKSYGDPYTVFMPPEDAELFAENIAGEFGGVGMEVGMQKDAVTIIAPLPNSPAEKAGVLSGDVLVKFDDVSTEGMSVDEAVLKIRGEKGTQVKLTFFREGDSEFREITVTRDTIVIPTIKTEEKDGAFVIRLYNFSATSEAQMQDALRDFIKGDKKKLVIDLRGNPGGFLQSAVGIASYFLPTGKVIVRESFGEGKEETVHRSAGRDLHQYRDFDLVILVDGGSASASEILAGALQEHGVATLIGTHTFGKGSVQEVVPLSGGSSLKVTIARWLTPNGRSISNGGLAPDVTVEFTKEDREAKKDPQFDAAIEFLNRN